MALDDDPPQASYELPTLPAGEVLFAPLFFDPVLAAAEAKRKGVWAQPQLAEQAPQEIHLHAMPANINPAQQGNIRSVYHSLLYVGDAVGGRWDGAADKAG